MEKNNKVKRAALYMRVSTDEQAKHGLSLDEQRHDLREYALEHNYSIIGEYTDDGTTARKSLKKRKALGHLLDDVREGKIDIILFIKLDRWFRNVADFYQVQSILDANNVKWIATQESYNTTTSNGQLMLNIRLSIAQNESDQTRDRINFVFEGKKRRKEVLSGNLPYGYKVDDNKHIAIDEKQAQAIRDIFNHFLLHQTILGTLVYAREKYGITWRHISLRRALANESYIGTFYGIKDYAPAIVDAETFKEVQFLLNERRRMASPRVPKIPFLFSGLIHCPVCGHVLVADRGRPNSKGEYLRKHYRCPIHNVEKSCEWPGTIFEHPLERYLLDHLKEQLQRYINNMRTTTGTRKESRTEKTINESLKRIQELYVLGYIDHDTFKQETERYRGLLHKEHERNSQQIAGTLALSSILSMDIEATYNQLDLEERRVFWHAILRGIDITHYEKGRNGKKDFRLYFL